MRKRKTQQPGSPLLAIDIGNTTIGVGLFPHAEIAAGLVVSKIPTRNSLNPMALRRVVAASLRHMGIPDRSTLGVILASVVPASTPKVVEALSPWCAAPLVADWRLAAPLLEGLPSPGKVGADRIANALGSWHILGRPAAVIDFGTATTVTIVGRGPRFLGGAIMPGIGLMNTALSSGTAKLAAARLELPVRFVGTDTEGAIRTGILQGTAGAVERIVAGAEKELGTKLGLIVTGGYSGLVAPLLARRHFVAPGLTFEGLRVLYGRRERKGVSKKCVY